jgi:hypothetical protein
VISRLQEVFMKFELKIKKVEICSSVLRKREVIKLLNIAAKTEVLLFYDVEFLKEEEEEILEDSRCFGLKKLQFNLCTCITPKIILKVPCNVLKNVTIENCIIDKETLRKIFDQQKSIEELEFDPYYVDPTSMKDMKLKKLKLMCNRHVAEIIQNQMQLQSLDLSKAHIGDVEFLKVCKLIHLKSLKLWIDRVSWEILDNLSNLKNLDELSLNYDRLEVEYVRNVTRIRMENIRKLKIKFPRLKITAESFAEMSQNMVNVKHLHVSNQSIGVIGALLENFKNLETLVIGCDSDSSEVVDFPINNLRHEKLQELCIYNSYPEQKTLKCSNTILQIINVLGNLTRLKLHNVIAVSEQQMNDLFNSHHLTHFCVVHPNEAIEFGPFSVHALINHKLKYFKSLGAEICVHKKMLEKEFRKKFSFVEIKAWKRQIVLRDCKWVHADE